MNFTPEQVPGSHQTDLNRSRTQVVTTRQANPAGTPCLQAHFVAVAVVAVAVWLLEEMPVTFSLGVRCSCSVFLVSYFSLSLVAVIVYRGFLLMV